MRNSKLLNIIIFFTMIFFLSRSLRAQTIITDRPDQTESSSTVGKGNLQIESGILAEFKKENKTTTRQLLIPTNLFRYGITKGIEIRVLNQFETIKKGNQSFSGITDLELGTKIQIFKKENSTTEIAFLSHIIIPTGTKELTNDKVGTINKLSISHKLSKNIGLGYNVGYNYFGTGKGDITYSASLGISVNERVGLYLEPYGGINDIKNFETNFDAGMTYLINPNFQLDFSFGTGINHKMNYFSLGFSWRALKG